MSNADILRPLIRTILQQAQYHEWSLQGFGMLRLYLSKETRLHIWHSAYRVPGVSDIHDHPWDFTSKVICGEVTNRQYLVQDNNSEKTHMSRTIRCGPGGGPCESMDPKPVALWRYHEFVARAGDQYLQKSEQIHSSHPEDGTVTLVHRYFKENTEFANVFYPIESEWVSAEPRPAMPSEVKTFVNAALARLE